MYDRILVPTDGSAGMDRVIDHAVRLAEAHGAELHAVYVINTGSFAGLPVESAWEGVEELLRSDAEAAVATVERLAADSGVAVHTHVVEGTPPREIVTHAEDAGCDLIVMGTHGRGGLDRLLLGSVAETVIRAAETPVLTVHVERVSRRAEADDREELEA